MGLQRSDIFIRAFYSYHSKCKRKLIYKNEIIQIYICMPTSIKLFVVFGIIFKNENVK